MGIFLSTELNTCLDTSYNICRHKFYGYIEQLARKVLCANKPRVKKVGPLSYRLSCIMYTICNGTKPKTSLCLLYECAIDKLKSRCNSFNNILLRILVVTSYHFSYV